MLLLSATTSSIFEACSWSACRRRHPHIPSFFSVGGRYRATSSSLSRTRSQAGSDQRTTRRLKTGCIVSFCGCAVSIPTTLSCNSWLWRTGKTLAAVVRPRWDHVLWNQNWFAQAVSGAQTKNKHAVNHFILWPSCRTLSKLLLSGGFWTAHAIFFHLRSFRIRPALLNSGRIISRRLDS